MTMEFTLLVHKQIDVFRLLFHDHPDVLIQSIIFMCRSYRGLLVLFLEL